MNNETILYFSDDDIGTGTGTGAYKASRFMGLDQTGLIYLLMTPQVNHFKEWESRQLIL